MQYADYAVWQREQLAGEVLERQLAYWKERLAGVPELLELPTDHPRPAVQSFRGAAERIELPGELLERLQALGRSEDATLFMVLLRGSEYGAIDAALAMLDGVLNLTFDDLLSVSGLMTFDLIRSASANGITGDFDSVSFSGLPDGYFLTSGVVFDGVEVYRVQLARVPEPGTLLLVLGGLATLLVSRRRVHG